METNSNKCQYSKLRPGDIANSFFDAFRSSAGQYDNGIQLSTMISMQKVRTACKHMQKENFACSKYRNIIKKLLFVYLVCFYICIVFVTCICCAIVLIVE